MMVCFRAHKLVSALCLASFSLGSAVLVDDFSDVRISMLPLQSGTELTDVVRFFDYSVDSGWVFNQNQIHFTNNDMKQLTYRINDLKYTAGEFINFKLNFYTKEDKSSKPIIGSIRFTYVDDSATYWENVNFISKKKVNLKEVEYTHISALGERIVKDEFAKETVKEIIITFNHLDDQKTKINSLNLCSIEVFAEISNLVRMKF